MRPIRIRRFERGLRFRHGDFAELLTAGNYLFLNRLWSGDRDRVEVYDTRESRFEHEMLDVLVDVKEVRDELVVVDVGETQKALVWKDARFEAVLGPGRYAYWRRPAKLEIQLFDTLEPRFEHSKLEALVEVPELRDELLVVDLSDAQRALVWKDSRLVSILGPGRYAYWRRPSKIRVEIFDATDFRFEHDRLDSVMSNSDAARWLRSIEVDENEEVLLYRCGEFVEKLRRGRNVFWTGTGDIRWDAVDLREKTLDVAGQEIMTKDKVTLRLNLIVTYRVTDSTKATQVVSDAGQALYREAQLVLRAAVGTRLLDELLTDKVAVCDEIESDLVARVAEFGVAIRSIGLRDVILPGEMKGILNQVIEAEKQAQANLIRRREETAAARSQANTAKLLADNPVLARMKELEALQDILAGTRATFVLGSGHLSDQISSLVRDDLGRDASS